MCWFVVKTNNQSENQMKRFNWTIFYVNLSTYLPEKDWIIFNDS
jgi:hypothetical protein